MSNSNVKLYTPQGLKDTALKLTIDVNVSPILMISTRDYRIRISYTDEHTLTLEFQSEVPAKQAYDDLIKLWGDDKQTLTELEKAGV